MDLVYTPNDLQKKIQATRAVLTSTRDPHEARIAAKIITKCWQLLAYWLEENLPLR